MKTDSFRRFLKGKYGKKPFFKNGRIKKKFVREKVDQWSPVIRKKAHFFLNMNRKHKGTGAGKK